MSSWRGMRGRKCAFCSAVPEQRGSGQQAADPAQSLGDPGRDALLGEHEILDRAQPLAAVFGRPGQAVVPGLDDLVLPGPAELDVLDPDAGPGRVIRRDPG